jgi:hypothetical protein
MSARQLSTLIPLMLMATLIFAQVPPPPQGFPPQDPGTAPQGSADGGDQDLANGPGVARISLLNGDVSVRRGDSGDYVAATQNAPMMLQDSIQTGNGARAEVQFDNMNMIRLAQDTEVHFTELQPGRFQMQLGRGTVTYRMLRDVNAQVEIDTPSVSVRPARMGIYRITVSDDGQTYITPRAGQVEVFTPKGSQTVQPGQTMMARGPSSDPEFQMVAGLNRDEWDGWSDSRDQGLQQAWANNNRYVPPGVYGTEDLAGRGQWVNTPEYGYAWSPYVGPDWSPYSVGRWAWEDYYGWTWISYDPWGWAPYHYGRWFFRTGFGWCWWPGSLGVRAYWGPAYVGFFGFGHGFGGVGFGRIGWVALAPHERFSPWYGRAGIRSTVTVNNVNVVNSYRNARIGNGVMATNGQTFGHGATGFSHVTGTELHTASVLHGSLPVTPTSQSLHFTDRQTNTTARTNFGQSRFATHMTPSSSFQRTPFTSSTTGANTGGSWNRYGSGSATTGTNTIPGARAFGSTPGTRNIPQTTSPGGQNWNRFGSAGSVRSGSSSTPAPTYRAPSYGSGNYGANNGRSQLRVSPPMVRERSGSSVTPNSNAPRYNAPSYSAPRYSPPTYSTPHYSSPAPAPRSSAPAPAPRSSGGGGGGGGHSSGGGGHHR